MVTTVRIEAVRSSLGGPSFGAYYRVSGRDDSTLYWGGDFQWAKKIYEKAAGRPLSEAEEKAVKAEAGEIHFRTC